LLCGQKRRQGQSQKRFDQRFRPEDPFINFEISEVGESSPMGGEGERMIV
jgi:hypothetical protein